MSKLLTATRKAAIVFGALALLTPAPAYAGPLAGLVPLVIGVVVKNTVLKLALSVAASLAISLLQKQKSRSSGIKIESTLNGGTNPRTIIAGLYATAGSNVTPPMSYGSAKKTPNANLVKIIALADVPIDGLSRVIINGEYVPLGGGPTHYTFGGKYAGKGNLRFFDGRQLTADSTTVAALYNYPNRPWTNQRVGLGVAYAVVTFFYDQELYKGEPEVRFEVRGMRFYDVRKDSTAGGSGSHRWDNPSTWEFTTNNVVIIYNILRGITLAGGAYYGGNCTADQLPVANWAAAMNICDTNVSISEGVVKKYQGGYEWSVDDQPADVIEEFLKGCAGEIVENGGVYKIRVGGPGLPVLFITDDDWLITEEEELDPFPGIHGSVNTVRAVYPHPDELWQQHDAPTVFNQNYIDMDEGQELIADLSLPAVPYPNQVQRLMYAWLEDDRRWRRHTGVLSHKAFALEPLDVISWSSAYNGYSDKLFDTSAAGVNFYNLQVSIAIREVDPSDYDWDPSFELPDPVADGGWALPESQAVEDFAVQAWTVKDADSDDRRPAIRVTWAADGADDATAIRIVVRIPGTEDIVSDQTVATIGSPELIISEGILPSTTYEVRGRYVVERPTLWTSWFGITTGNVLLGPKDFDFDEMLEALGSSTVIPQITKPVHDGILQQIKDAAFNDLAERRQNILQMDVFKNIYENVAAIRHESLVRLTEDEAIVSQLNVQVARINANQAAIINEALTRATADEALSTTMNDISARLNNFGGSGLTAEARITQVDTARVDGDAALGTRIDSVEVNVGNNAAAITNESIARANADSAIAANVTSVTARLNNAGGSGITVEQAFIAQADDITGLEGQYTLRINANNRISGFGLAVDGSGESEFAILADRFLVTDSANNSVTGYPFQVVDGSVYIRKAFIQKITADQINVGNLQAISANIGDLDIRPAVAGGSGRIRIFDEADNERVILGRLT